MGQRPRMSHERATYALVVDPDDSRRSMWSFRSGLIGTDGSVKGFDAEATDGRIGKVAWASYVPGESYLVVTVRHQFLRSTHHVIPAGAVITVDPIHRNLRLGLTRREVEEAPRQHHPAAPVDPRSADFLAGLWPGWLNDHRA